MADFWEEFRDSGVLPEYYNNLLDYLETEYTTGNNHFFELANDDETNVSDKILEYRESTKDSSTLKSSFTSSEIEWLFDRIDDVKAQKCLNEQEFISSFYSGLPSAQAEIVNSFVYQSSINSNLQYNSVYEMSLISTVDLPAKKDQINIIMTERPCSDPNNRATANSIQKEVNQFLESRKVTNSINGKVLQTENSTEHYPTIPLKVTVQNSDGSIIYSEGITNNKGIFTSTLNTWEGDSTPPSTFKIKLENALEGSTWPEKTYLFEDQTYVSDGTGQAYLNIDKIILSEEDTEELNADIPFDDKSVALTDIYTDYLDWGISYNSATEGVNFNAFLAIAFNESGTISEILTGKTLSSIREMGGLRNQSLGESEETLGEVREYDITKAFDCFANLENIFLASSQITTDMMRQIMVKLRTQGITGCYAIANTINKEEFMGFISELTSVGDYNKFEIYSNALTLNKILTQNIINWRKENGY